MTETMRALVAGRGPDWVLTEMPIPQPGTDQVLIRNMAVAANNADLPMLASADPTHGGSGEESIAGFEYAGEIAAVGENVGDWRVGDPVMGSIPQAFAEYVVADGRFVLPRPQGLPATAADGHVVNIGRLAGPASRIDLDALAYRHLTVHGVSFGFTRDQEMAGIIAGLLPEVVPAVGRGDIRAIIDRTVSVEQFPDAVDRLRSGDAVGKIVLTFALFASRGCLQ